MTEVEEVDGQDGPQVTLPLKVAAPPPVPAVDVKTQPQFHPLAYRRVLSSWPDAWRERWGHRANALEEAGLAWRDAETQAFIEVWNQIRHEQQTASPATATMPAVSSDLN